MTEGKTQAPRPRAHVQDRRELYDRAQPGGKKRARNRAARTRLAAADDRVSDAAIEQATGKKWDEWFSILDAWGAEKRHAEIARFLNEEHDVGGWWAQSVMVGFLGVVTACADPRRS